jgi:AsmA protein
LWEGGTSAAAVNIASQRAKFDFTGEITGGPAKASGAIDLKMPSLRDFLAWAELKFPAGIDGFGPLTVSGRIAAAGSKLTLDNAAVTLDRIAATGALTAERGARRPTLSGHLDIDRLDLDPYVKAEAPPDATPSPGPAPKTAAPPAPKPSPTPSSWSEATINLAPLKLIDADLSLIANAMSFRQVETGKTVATLRLTDGRLGLDINDVALSGGKGTGRIVADSSGEVPGFGVALRLTGITVGHIAFAGFDELSGNVAATGLGLLDLPLRRIDYLWPPAIVGLGSARIAITSPWADPAYEVESVTITKRPLRRSAGRNDRPRECLDRRVAHVGLPIRV